MGLPIQGYPSRYHIWSVITFGEPTNADDLLVTKQIYKNATVLAGPFMTRRKARVAKKELIALRKLQRSAYEDNFMDRSLAGNIDFLLQFGDRQ